MTKGINQQIMKTYSNLFEKICTKSNFWDAYQNAIQGKKYYTEVKEIEKHPEEYLDALLEEVKSKKYKVSDYIVFHRFTGNKDREIFKLPMKDRIVQHAIMNICEPIFRETFIQDTYASIKGRGIHLGLTRVKKCLRKYKFKYCLKLDVHKCYPSLDKNILKQKLQKKFHDQDLIDLLNTIIDSCPNGVPIGNYTSQYFNNFYFNDFDHWVKEVKRIKGYFRYCDDMVFLGNNKEELRALYYEVKEQIEALNVTLKPNWQIYPVASRGVDFLGYIIRPTYVRLRKRTKRNFIQKVAKVNMYKPSEHSINVLGSYWGIIKHGDCRNLWFKYIKHSSFKGFMLEYKCRAKYVLGQFLKIFKVECLYKKAKHVVLLHTVRGDKYTQVLSTSKNLMALTKVKTPICGLIVQRNSKYLFKKYE